MVKFHVFHSVILISFTVNDGVVSSSVIVKIQTPSLIAASHQTVLSTICNVSLASYTASFNVATVMLPVVAPVAKVNVPPVCV